MLLFQFFLLSKIFVFYFYFLFSFISHLFLSCSLHKIRVCF